MIRTVSVIHHSWPLALFINMNQHESTFPKEEHIPCIRPILCVAVVGQSLCSKPPVASGLQTLALLRCSDLCEPRSRERWDSLLVGRWKWDNNGKWWFKKEKLGIYGNMSGIIGGMWMGYEMWDTGFAHAHTLRVDCFKAKSTWSYC